MKIDFRYMKGKWILGVLGAVVILTACKKDLSPEEQMEKDTEIIEHYIAENNLNAERDPSGLYYVIEDLGTGNHPEPTDDVTVRYKGYFTDGKVFDESQPEGVTFNLQQVIKGWTIGIPKFKEGGNGILLIPSALGYGSQGNSSIPPNSVLIFDVSLLDIVE